MKIFKKISLILLSCFGVTTAWAAETPSSTDEEIIHYAFFLDKDIAHHEYVNDLQKELATKIEQTIPNAIVSCSDYTTQDLADADYYAYHYFKLGKNATALVDEFCCPDEVCPQLAKSISLVENIKKSHRTIIIINAHGGNYPYTVGKFCPEQSYLATRHNIEFMILSCAAGNMNLNDKIKSKITGASRQDEVDSEMIFILLLEYLNSDSITVPTSAFEFYENLRKIQNQVLEFTLWLLNLKTNCIGNNSYLREYVAYYIDSLPATAIELFSSFDFLPGNSPKAWYADVLNEIYYGEKNTPWLLTPNAQSKLSIDRNTAIITLGNVIRCMIPPVIAILCLNKLKTIWLNHLP